MIPKIGGKTPKMDGEYNGTPFLKMDDLGVKLFLQTPIWPGFCSYFFVCFETSHMPVDWCVKILWRFKMVGWDAATKSCAP